MKTKMEPKNQFIAIWLALIVLLFVMFGLAHFDVGPAGTAIILAMAFIQMILVLSFFMRLRTSVKLIRVIAGVGFLWLLILFILAFSDYMMRQWH